MVQLGCVVAVASAAAVHQSHEFDSQIGQCFDEIEEAFFFLGV